MTESELREMRRKLDDQYKRDRETIDRMLDLVIRSKGAGNPSSPPAEIEKGLTINERIAKHVYEMEGNFTMQDAWKFIKDQDPEFGVSINRQTMSTAIWKLNKSGEIKVIIPKKGKSAAIYSQSWI